MVPPMAIVRNREDMEHRHRHNYIYKIRAIVPYCNDKWIPKIAVVSIFTVLLIVLLFVFQPFQSEIHVLFINGRDPPIHITNDKYLSVALDSSLIAEDFRGFNMTNPRLLKVIRHVGGGYLRVGGTMADRLIFNSSNGTKLKSEVYEMLDGDDCAYDESYCKPMDRRNFTLSGTQWLALNKLANNTNLTILFDINCLLRHDNGSWNSRNAEELIEFSDNHNLDLIWELGNEPNAFRHVFNYTVTAHQLAEDFSKLKRILKKYSRYKNVLLVGPDVTRPKVLAQPSTEYLQDFLEKCSGDIDAITWHQYYFNGRDVSLYDFIKPDIFDMLIKEIMAIKGVVKAAGCDKKSIWLGETGSAYGGGSPSYSDRFLATFIWMDKLGVAAKNGIDVVVRQSLYKGHYALISDSYDPNPDWWVSVLYKRLVGNKVVECFAAAPPAVRLYCHCNAGQYYTHRTAVTVYGMNLKSSEAVIRIQEGDSEYQQLYEVLGFVLQTHITVVSKHVFLNDEMLILDNGELPPLRPVNLTTGTITIPPFSLGFWIVQSPNFVACN